MQFKSIILAFAASTSLVHAVAIPQETLHNTCLDPYLGLLTAFGLDLQHLGFAADDAVTCTACLSQALAAGLGYLIFGQTALAVAAYDASMATCRAEAGH